MVGYKIIKYCKLCKERFVVEKGSFKRYLCDKCEKVAEKSGD